ncbi:NADPH-dependent FMN reductase [Merismopedia glauca]|uniref:NADPH-dependent FMN reductase-like domain-containing protein n=1 Tax=Merismopedia glauca CCAP 1448/3 TaxID=1296344 RepID=A0A2T1C4R0_9CYAN|nr:hypothetical protein [Merismopedia glauca]PSB03148.1 hypothetical protein C7B64_09710 [Merismopedia glauca CCAP 1448/3]
MINFQIIAISGSLRAVCWNNAVLKAATKLAPKNVKITLYTGLADLTHFNPDLDQDPLPDPVIALRQFFKVGN